MVFVRQFFVGLLLLAVTSFTAVAAESGADPLLELTRTVTQELPVELQKEFGRSAILGKVERGVSKTCKALLYIANPLNFGKHLKVISSYRYAPLYIATLPMRVMSSIVSPGRHVALMQAGEFETAYGSLAKTEKRVFEVLADIRLVMNTFFFSNATDYSSELRFSEHGLTFRDDDGRFVHVPLIELSGILFERAERSGLVGPKNEQSMQLFWKSFVGALRKSLETSTSVALDSDVVIQLSSGSSALDFVYKGR